MLYLYQYTISKCESGPCPVIYKTTEGDYVVQGYNVLLNDIENMNIANNESAVFVPRAIIDDLVSKYNK